jgi:hypothetical protein
MEDDADLVAALDDEDEEYDESQDEYDRDEEDEPEDAGNELDRIDPQHGETMTLKCGIEVHVLPMRTRQLFKLLRIITHGAGQALQNAGLDFAEDPSVFMSKLVGIVAFSIPDAEQETVDFLQSMVEPSGLVDKMPRDLSKQERENNVTLWTELNQELWNPDPLDTIDLVENIVAREAKDIQALGKRVRQLVELASKTGQLSGKPAPASPAPNSSGSSAVSSTRSRTSTAGRTSKSSTSRSGGSAKSAARSSRGSATKNATAAS